ncbi:hypothetical protein OIU79_016963 [Salix purpurea]|uniref:Uncharacterized protein n=1 Tax=Salix purpurea TaxID=77065 RepID=A0A9Q1AJ86_SALPP|nr:hypothetical protein OIU79_016963 [Salix purpurea]
MTDVFGTCYFHSKSEVSLLLLAICYPTRVEIRVKRVIPAGLNRFEHWCRQREHWMIQSDNLEATEELWMMIQNLNAMEEEARWV